MRNRLTPFDWGYGSTLGHYAARARIGRLIATAALAAVALLAALHQL